MRCAWRAAVFVGTPAGVPPLAVATIRPPSGNPQQSATIRQPPQEAARRAADCAGFVRQEAKNWAEDPQIVERLNGDIDGWYPRLGGMTRGGGFAIGPGYRVHLGSLSSSICRPAFRPSRYKAADVKVRWLKAFNERVELWTNYRFEDFPQEDFFGIGLDSQPRRPDELRLRQQRASRCLASSSRCAGCTSAPSSDT